jgi:glutamyl-tRNA(Gln) amidotransferase subunit E
MHDEKYYGDLGFVCGLEIHQRLATRSKLFCSCDASISSDVSVSEIERMQRAVSGELGKIDPSASFESARGRRFIYNTFRRSSCLVDIDEEPPHALNREALAIAMQIAASLGMRVPSELEVMRKGVVDGSDPSAFQRTLLVGYGGKLRVGKREITIPDLFLEEESSGIEHSDRETVIYNVDRLGVPLVEMDTAPEIRTPEEAKAVAKRIGLILRVTGKVQRGIGSIRQDVNVSIKGGDRVEIKGFQELESMDAVIEHEVERHVKLLELKKLLLKRKAKVHNPEDVTEIFKGTNAKILKQSVESGGTVFGARLEGFGGALGTEVNPDRRLGSEISDYARMAGVGGIIHSDEDLGRYDFNHVELASLRKRLGLKDGDAFMLITGQRETAAAAIGFALRRAAYAMEGVPRETRGHDDKKLITTFMRPLPGGSRMYPETDVRPIPVDHREYEALKKSAIDPDRLAEWLEKEIGNRQLSEQMLWSSYLPLFKEILERTKVSGSVVAPILLEKTRELKRSGVDVDRMGNDAFARIFELYREGEVTKAAMGEILKRAPEGGADVDRIVRENKLERISKARLEAVIKKFGNKSREELTKEIMSSYRLNVDGEELKALLGGRGKEGSVS